MAILSGSSSSFCSLPGEVNEKCVRQWNRQISADTEKTENFVSKIGLVFKNGIIEAGRAAKLRTEDRIDYVCQKSFADSST